MHPVAHAFGLGRTVVGVAAEGVFGAFAESHFMEVLVAGPFPENVAVPVHFQNQVVQQELVRDVLVAGIAVGQNQGVARIRLGFHARRVISHRVALALVVVMVAGHPAARCAGVFNKFIAVEFPDDVAVPIHLHQIQIILYAVFAVAQAARGQNLPAGQEFVGHAVDALPDFDLAAVHVHEHRAHFVCLKDGEAVPAFVGIVHGHAGGIDARMAHVASPFVLNDMPRPESGISSRDLPSVVMAAKCGLRGSWDFPPKRWSGPCAPRRTS